ncbi:acyltransferase [Algoriphagus aestuariicola]|uniref:Acyltransferase n=1 Tax=Algoriphagus aestuariicola TaxID=1852016 RepID=A0ABS3BWS9_9BACT|nr:acyltransferase [Algoriphagus aestuariicola]MBN7803558.1 acyltransferase [Algoriphagus aestuariicola]
MKKQLLIPETLSQNNFDLLRFLLASAVIFCHCYAIFYGWQLFAENEPFMKWSGGKISIGSAAVNFFFVISGFLILRSFEGSANFPDFLKKRVLRIYPGFIVAFLLCIFVFGPIGHIGHSWIKSYGEFIKYVPLKLELANMLSLQSPIEAYYFNHLPQTGLNNSMWTIQYEFICYLAVPLLVWLGFLKYRLGLAIVFVASYAWLALQNLGLVFPHDPSLSGHLLANPHFYPRFFTYFLAGSFAYAYRHHIPRNNALLTLSLPLFVLAFKLQQIDLLWPIAGTYLLFYCAYHPKVLFPKFAKHGDFSYGIYLYGWPLQQLIMLYWGEYLTPLTFFALVMPVVLIFAVASWNLVEKPALKLKQMTIRQLKLIPMRQSVLRQR